MYKRVKKRVLITLFYNIASSGSGCIRSCRTFVMYITTSACRSLDIIGYVCINIGATTGGTFLLVLDKIISLDIGAT